MKLGVVALQKQYIEQLQSRDKELTSELIAKIEENAKLLRVLAYLVDPKFRDYLKSKNTDAVIADYLESDNE